MKTHRVLRGVAMGLVQWLFWDTATTAQVPGDTVPEEQTEHTVETSGGQTQVHYYNNGAITSETRIPSDSMFWTSGQGRGGGVPQACRTFVWTKPVEPELDPVTSQPLGPPVDTTYTFVSFAWRYREIDPSGSWSPEVQGQVEDLDASWSLAGQNLKSEISEGEAYRAGTQPLAVATRRFRQSCATPEGFENDEGLLIGAGGEFGLDYVDVPLTDPFWNPLTRLGILWGMIQLAPFEVIPPPEVGTYGGLVVNMPTWLQIEADAWRPYFTGVDQYMGWYSQLGLFPAALGFEVVGAGGGTIPCAPEDSEARGGAIPGWPDELPRYYELGQLGEDCTWVPQERGEVTIRARITYNVLLTISGYSEWLSPYVWYSDPLTLPVGELRIRNVTPEGGIGE